MKKILAILAVIFVAIVAISCTKEKQTEDNQAAELLGSWRGSAVTTWINGKPVDEVIYTLTFTADKITIDVDGEAQTFPFTVGKNLDGTKYFTVMDGTMNFSVFYSISGTTLNNLGGNSTASLFWPKTFEKAVL